MQKENMCMYKLTMLFCLPQTKEQLYKSFVLDDLHLLVT